MTNECLLTILKCVVHPTENHYNYEATVVKASNVVTWQKKKKKPLKIHGRVWTFFGIKNPQNKQQDCARQSASEFGAAAFLAAVFDDALVDALQPQSLSVQVARPRRSAAGEEPRPLQWRLLAEQGEFGVCLYGLGQEGSEGVEGLVDLCVDLDGRRALGCGGGSKILLFCCHFPSLDVG